MIFQKINYYYNDTLIELPQFFKEKLASLTQNIPYDFIKNHSSQLISLGAIFLLMILISPQQVSKASYKTNIRFQSNKPYDILTSSRKVSVNVGESEFNKQQREQQAAELAAKSKIVRVGSSYDDPADFDPIYKAAGVQFGVPWQILKAVHYVETGCSGSTTKSSYAGARGPMQFMPGTWRAYGVDGNGDGNPDIYNVNDAIYGAANLLAHAGAADGNIDGALFSYNHSQSYVNKVKEVASSIS